MGNINWIWNNLGVCRLRVDLRGMGIGSKCEIFKLLKILYWGEGGEIELLRLIMCKIWFRLGIGKMFRLCVFYFVF